MAIRLVVCFLLLSVLSSIDADHLTKITAILNQEAFLPCEIRDSVIDWNGLSSRPLATDQINLILWYRDGTTVPFYAIDGRLFPSRAGPRHRQQHHAHYTERDNEEVARMLRSIAMPATAKHITNDSRVQFDAKGMTPILRIANVTERDSGVYHCRVEYASHRTFHSQIRLIVIGAPISLHIADSDGNALSGVIGPYNEFESVTLICKVYGGSPKPSVVWFRQKQFYEEIVDDSFETVSLDTPVNGTLTAVVNELQLRRLDRDDYLARYICRTSSRYYYPPLVQSIVIDMNLTVRIYTNQYHTSSQSLLAGQEVEFGCRTEGSKPNAKIEWFFDHQRIVSRETSYYNFSQRKRFDEDTESTTEYPLPDSTRFVSIIVSHRANSTLSLIRFIPSYTDNNKVLSCYVWNPFIVNSKISDMLTLDVKYAPLIELGSNIRRDIRSTQINWTDIGDEPVLIGEHLPLLELHCHIKSNPWVEQVVWYYNSSPVEAIDHNPAVSQPQPSISSGQLHFGSMSLANHNQTLRITNVDRSYSGNYQCVARNSINITSSEIVQINVAYKPACSSNETRLLELTRNVPQPMTCAIEANPPPDLLHHWAVFSPWSNAKHVPKRFINGTDVLDVEWAVKQFLDLSPQDTDSTLLLQCEGSNVAGKQEYPCSFLLHIQNGPPEKVSNCSFREQSNTVLVCCLAGDDGGLNQTVHLIAFPSTGLLSDDTFKSTTPPPSPAYRSDITRHTDYDSSIQQTLVQLGITPKWNYNQTAQSGEQFEVLLDNITVNQSYDLIIYSQNIIGTSETLLILDSILATESEPTAAAGTSQTFLRIKGFLVVAGLVFLIALMALLFKSYLYATSSYGSNNHDYHDGTPPTPPSTPVDVAEMSGTRHRGPNLKEVSSSINSVDSESSGQLSEIKRCFFRILGYRYRFYSVARKASTPDPDLDDDWECSSGWRPPIACNRSKSFLTSRIRRTSLPASGSTEVELQFVNQSHL